MKMIQSQPYWRTLFPLPGVATHQAHQWLRLRQSQGQQVVVIPLWSDISESLVDGRTAGIRLAGGEEEQQCRWRRVGVVVGWRGADRG